MDLTPKKKVQVKMAEGKLSEKGATRALVKHYSSAKSKALERAKGKSRNIASTGLNTKTGRYTPEAMKHMLSKSRKGYSEK